MTSCVVSTARPGASSVVAGPRVSSVLAWPQVRSRVGCTTAPTVPAGPVVPADALLDHNGLPVLDHQGDFILAIGAL